MSEAGFCSCHEFADPVGLAGDASARAYARVSGRGRTAILMRTTEADAALFVARAAWLAREGLSVPAILGREGGLLLLEDFGDATYPRVLAAGSDPVALYAQAGRALAVLRRAPVEGLPAWDPAAMARAAAATFCDWWWPRVMEGEAPREAIERAVREMLAPFAGEVGAVHRDFFAGNLMWLPERHGVRRAGVLDFQDAAAGHPAYDLVSLVEDARRDVPEAARAAALAGYGEPVDPGAMAACAAQRHLRVAGLWVRLARRDHKPAYLAHGPRTWALLERALAHPACAPLARALAVIPAGRRGNPVAVAA